MTTTNRLRHPDSKVGALRWVETIALSNVMTETIEHQHLLLAMYAMVKHKDDVDQELARLLLLPVDQDLAVVF